MAVRDPLLCLDHRSLRGHRSLEDAENPLDFGKRVLTAVSATETELSGEEDQVRLLLEFFTEHVQEHGESEQSQALFETLPFDLDLTSNRVSDQSGEAGPGLSLSLSRLLTSGCIVVRQAAALASLFELVSSCDTFIRFNFGKMLSEKEILILPRLQVNVNVCDNSQDLWSADTCALNRILPAVVRELGELSSSCMNAQGLEEKVVEMNLLSDLSVEVTDAKKSTKYLSPEKPMADYINLSKKKQPSPARKLHLGGSQDSDDGSDPHSKLKKKWSVVANENVSASAALCVVSRSLSEGLVVLNVQLVSKDCPDAICPISPTTGVPLSTGSTLLSQMTLARSGFGLVAIGDSVMSVGGFNRNGVLSDVECFNGGVNSWCPSGRLTCKRARMSVVKWKDNLYAIGGSDGKFELGSMEELQLSSSDKQWKKLTVNLCTPRSDFSAAVLGDKIYAVGGMFYSEILRSTEVFDIKDKKWRQVAPMSMPRKGAAVVACNGKIFALGGQRSSWNCLSMVECYDPSINQWSQVAPMATARRNASAITVEDRIYVMGGYNGSRAVDTMEVYNPVSNEWSIGKPMTLRRSGASSVVMGEAVYVVGGFTGSSFLNSMEKYDLESEQWTSFIV